MRYNPIVFLGPYDECGKIDIFKTWKEKVNESKPRKLIHKFID